MLQLADLAVDVPIITMTTSVHECDRTFRRSERIDALIVTDGCAIHVVEREAFLSWLTGPLGFGRALHLDRPIGVFAPPAVEPLPASTRISAAAALASARAQRGVFTPLVVDVDGTLKMVPIASLFHELSVQLGRENHTDFLTGLANRRALDARLGEPDLDLTAIALIDLDDFKLVNDALGHHRGDELLKIIARRLEACAGSNLVVRLGGDEFAICIDGEIGAGEIDALMVHITHVVAEPVTVDHLTMRVTASIGVAQRRATDSAESLLRHADAALYAAKRAGRNCHQMFDQSPRGHSRRQLELSYELRQAIEAREISVVYQPVFDLLTGERSSYEALARWQHHELGAISPAEFIPVAETSGLVSSLGHLVREASVGWVAAHRQHGGRVAVNLSRRELLDPNLVESFDRLLDLHGVPGHCITVEVTETATVDDLDKVVPTLRELRRRGITVSLDDFGAGVTSIANLRVLPLDNVKLDRALIAPLLLPGFDGLRAERCVSALIALCHGHDLTVTAEGIEHQTQLDILRELRCDFGQGWHLGKPGEHQPSETLEGVRSEFVVSA